MPDDGKVIDLTATAGPRAKRDGEGARLNRGQALGRYMILELLGQGGMGVVYAAYDPDLDRKVALKLLRRGGSSSRSARARLLREARAMAKLHHPNVITVYEVGTVGDEDFVAMQYVDGSNLSDWLRQGALRATPDQVIASFVQAGRGLAAAHRAGLIHRDFKPTNVLVDAEGRVRVMDFGLVQRTDEVVAPEDSLAGGQPSLDGLTRTGATLGTPAYMAPEQYLGGEIDERTDQFSFCVALYEALYGERPYEGEDYDSLRDAVTRGAVRAEPDGADVPSWLRRILLRGLRVDRDDRYPSMDALLADLGRDPAIARRRWMLGGAAIVLAAGALALSLRGGRAEDAVAICADSASQLDGVWDDGVRERVRDAFKRVRVPDETAERAFTGFAGALDLYAREWTEMHAQSCRATYVDRTQSEDDFHLRGGCLREKRDELSALAEVFTRADEEAVEQAVQAARGLGRLGECADVESLRAGFAPPQPDQKDAVAELRVVLSEIKALDDAGQKGRALKLAQDALRRAREVGYRPILAEALHWAGRVSMGLEHSTEARAELEEAILVAEEAGHLRVRAESMVLMTGLTAQFTSRIEEARLWSRRAAAAIKSLGGDKLMEGRLNLYLASTHVQERDFPAALALLEKSRALYHSLGDQEKEAQTLISRAEVQMRRKRFRDALELYREALVIYENELGRDHPRVALAMEGFARNLRAVGSYDSAREYFGRAEKYWATERGRTWLADHRLPGSESGERVIRGRVTDAKGKPVAKAEVVIGAHIAGDGRYLYASDGGLVAQRYGVEHTTTGDDGSFEFESACACDLLIAAEHWGAGRSRAQPIAAGTEPHTVGVVLEPVGSVRGRVVVGGKLAVGSIVMLARRPGKSRSYQVAAVVGQDGTYRLEGVTRGRWQLLLVDEVDRGEHSIASQREVEVVAGEEVVADIDVAAGEMDLIVSVRGKGGASVESAQILVVHGIVKARTGGALQKKLLTAFATGGLKSAFVAHGQTKTFAKMTPGLYTVCIVPLSGDFRDPDFTARLAPRVFDLEVHCEPVDVLPGKAEQRFEAVVSPMPPLLE